MHVTDRFQKFAAECELMAKSACSRENRAVWNGLAQRWLRCVELLEQQESNLRRAPATLEDNRMQRTAH
jgi:hypothetical protein